MTIAITRLVELEAVKVSEIVITKKNKNIADHSVNRVFYATPLSFYSNYLSMLGLYKPKSQPLHGTQQQTQAMSGLQLM